MNFISKWFAKKPDAPAADDSLTSAFEIARFLAFDQKNPNQQWFVDTALRAEINMANAKWAWDAANEGRLKGHEDFFRGCIFMMQLIGASPATRAKLVSMMKGA